MVALAFGVFVSPAVAADLYVPPGSERYSEVYTYEREYRRPPRVTVIEPEETETVVIERRPVIVRRPAVVEREVVIEPRVERELVIAPRVQREVVVESRVYDAPVVYDPPVYAYGYPAVRHHDTWRHPRPYYRY
jgi:hypothetical protein